ncbi:flagellar basal-body rod modification protein FlgD [Rhodovulum sp. ES.010]|uniref:flagellar hook capping FlgD N-terminal domain-containing protein n=1 Tax=Rhodovulum sp. ES.010 TaxID=1882821 RepID=UPI00092BCE6C|nr:flagellar hook capping FlgD N-terminal domain-containing protein [Rhodovulum sp. ES.010]SIO49964.1 flagellar basal-body rod modification protein FlgD [Rhodovulum sp. ES.010]
MDSVTSATAASAASTARDKGDDSKKGAISSDFETFLRMLTVQMENQDPLNPIESSDYAVQLATFSGVEQQVLTNDLLETLGQNLGGAGLAQYGSWVGMEARAAVPAAFDGSSPVTVVPQAAADADKAQLVVRDADGKEVQRLSIGTDGAPMEWTGAGTDGAVLPAGSYRFVVESFKEGARIAEKQAEVYAPITEVRSGTEGVTVVFAGGGEASAGNVSALRQGDG